MCYVVQFSPLSFKQAFKTLCLLVLQYSLNSLYNWSPVLYFRWLPVHYKKYSLTLALLKYLHYNNYFFIFQFLWLIFKNLVKILIFFGGILPLCHVQAFKEYIMICLHFISHGFLTCQISIYLKFIKLYCIMFGSYLRVIFFEPVVCVKVFVRNRGSYHRPVYDKQC